MSAFPSDYLIAQTLGEVDTTPYLALFTTNPQADGSGTEVTGGSYAREAITFSSITAGAISNSSEVRFTDLPAATITHWAIYDAVTGGNLKAYGAINSSIASLAGDEAVFYTDGISIAFAGS